MTYPIHYLYEEYRPDPQKVQAVGPRVRSRRAAGLGWCALALGVALMVMMLWSVSSASEPAPRVPSSGPSSGSALAVACRDYGSVQGSVCVHGDRVVLGARR